MSALPRFFVLAALAGVALWLVDAPYPFPLLATVIVTCSVAGFVLSAAYVHAFLPWQWRVKLAALRRAWRTVAHVQVR